MNHRMVKMRDIYLCVIGHKRVKFTNEKIESLKRLIEDLIVSRKVNCFLFGTNSAFNNICIDVVNELKEKYPHIRRYSVRHDMDDISPKMLDMFKRYYEDVIMSTKITKAKKNSYVARNKYMIDLSDICLFYFDENYLPLNDLKEVRKSGTKTAFEYAKSKKKEIINFFDL